MKRDKKTKNNRGSVTLEATISFSIALVLIFYLIGTMVSVTINEKINEIALEITGEMQLLGLPFIEDENIIVQVAKTQMFEQLILSKFRMRIKEENLSPFIKVNGLESSLKSDFQSGGTMMFHFSYDFKLPTLLKTQEIVYPYIGVIHADGLKFESTVVYRTNTGKKYHTGECQHLSQSKIAIDLEEAKKLKLGACKHCNPPKSDE